MPQPSWKHDQSLSLNASNLAALLHNELPAIRLPNLITARDCHELVVGLEQIGFRKPHYTPTHAVQRFGPSYYEYRNQGKAAYFATAQRHREIRKLLFSTINDPIQTFVECVRRETSMTLQVAHDDQEGNYFAGAARFGAAPLLHNDSAPRKMPSDWQIAHVTSQLGWNVYLQIPQHGGELVIYDKQWEPDDDQFVDAKGYFDWAVVEGVESVRLKPAIGEAILFHSFNYHYIVPSSEPRITMAMFLGQTPAGDLIYWS